MWLRVKPNTKFLTGKLLKFDHTTQSSNGNYLLAPLSVLDNAVATVQSPLLYRSDSSSNSMCVSLFYFAKPSNASLPVEAIQLKLLNLSRKNGGKNSDVVKISTSTSDGWTQFQHQFTALPNAYVLQLRTVYKAAIGSDVGVDDISISEGACKSGETTTAKPYSSVTHSSPFSSFSTTTTTTTTNSFSSATTPKVTSPSSTVKLPPVNVRPRNRSPPTGGIVAVAVIVSLVIVALLAVAFFYYRKRQASKQIEEPLAISMMTILKKAK